MAKFAAKDSNKNITLSPHGTGKVVVGTGATDATVQSDGNHNLVLQTGNSTTGSITITDGADGDIAITPNGTGEVDISKVDIDGGAIDAVTLGTNSAVTEAQIDNINVNGNAITSTNTDGNIDLTPNGTGEVNISKVDIDAGTVDGITLGTNSAVTEAQIDNINVNGNAITSTNTDGDIDLTPNGTGEVNISKVDIDSGTIDGVDIGVGAAATDIRVDNLRLNGNSITSTSANVDINITPDGTGEVNISKVDIDSGTIDGTNITVGSGKTLDVSAGTLTTSTAQKQAVVDGASITSSDVFQGLVMFDGTSGTPSARVSHNVSGITRQSTGTYTVSWDTDFANTDYYILTGSGAASLAQRLVTIITVTVGSVKFIVRNTSDSNSDTGAYLTLAAFTN